MCHDGGMENNQKPKRIRRDPEKHAAQKKAWKIAHRERVNEQARAMRADPEKRAHERELERIRRTKNRDEYNRKRRGTRSEEWQRQKTNNPEMLERKREKQRDLMRCLRSDPDYRAKEYAKERAIYAVDSTRSRGHTKKWRDNPKNRGKLRASWIRKRLVVAQQTPRWVDKEDLANIAALYANCPSGYHVDHIVPLRGKNVSGLHIMINLEYLAAKENMKKQNRFNAHEEEERLNLRADLLHRDGAEWLYMQLS